MSCLSWNCRSLGYPRAIPFLSDLVRYCKRDFIFFLETFSGMTAIEGIKNKLQYSDCFVVSNVGHRGGLAVLWKNEGTASILGSNHRFIDLVVKLEGEEPYRSTMKNRVLGDSQRLGRQIYPALGNFGRLQ